MCSLRYCWVFGSALYPSENSHLNVGIGKVVGLVDRGKMPDIRPNDYGSLFMHFEFLNHWNALRPKYKWFHLAEITEIVRSPCSSPRSHLRPTFKTPLRDLRERCNVFPELTPMVGFSHIESIWDSRCTTLPARSLSLMCSDHHHH